MFGKQKSQDLYPEYYLIKAGDFNENAVNDTLDEWVYFLKTGNVKDDFKATGIDKAKKKLEVAKLSPRKRKAYEHDTEYLRSEASWAETQLKKNQDLLKKGAIEIAKNMIKLNLGDSIISESTKLSMVQIEELKTDILRNKNSN